VDIRIQIFKGTLDIAIVEEVEGTSCRNYKVDLIVVLIVQTEVLRVRICETISLKLTQ
jgi:hypothetical protein